MRRRSVPGLRDARYTQPTIPCMPDMRLVSLASPHVANVAVATGVSASVALTAGPAAAALVATGVAAGGLAGSLTVTYAVSRFGPQRVARLAAAAWAALAAAGVSVAPGIDRPGGGRLATLTLLMGAAAFSWNVLHILAKESAGTWGVVWLRRVGPVGRVGAALGAVLGAAAATGGSSLLLLLLALPLIATSPGLSAAQRTAGKRALRWVWAVFWRNAALALVGYGPVTLYVAFVAATAGARWAGAAMAIYAATALLAPPLARKFPERLLQDPRSWLVLAALADLSWLATALNPLAGVLLARAVSAACLFVAEGAADVDAYHAGGAAAAVAGRLSGGLVAGAAGTALLLQGLAVPAVATLMAALALPLALALPPRRPSAATGSA